MLHREAITARALAQAAIFLTPALVAIAYGYRAAFAQTSVLLSGLWWAGIALFGATVYVQWRTLRTVLGMNKSTGYENALRKSSPPPDSTNTPPGLTP